MATKTVTVLTGGSGIDTTEFKDAVKALRKAEPILQRELRRELRAAGMIVAVEARAIASKSSKTIPPTIKVRTAGATVAIIAGGADAPVAALFELGNTGDRRSSEAAGSGTFRHPVFGRDAWVEQDMHRFLAPAALANLKRVDARIFAALDAVTDTLVHGKT